MKAAELQVKSLAVYEHPGILYAACADPESGRVYAGSFDYGVHVFDLKHEKKEPVARWASHDNYVSALVLLGHPSRRVVVSGSFDRRLIWWDAASGEVLRAFDAHAGWVRDLALLPDESRLVSVGDDMLVKIWEAGSGKPVRELEGHARKTPQGHVTALYALAVSPDGRHIASGDRIGDVRVWETESGKLAANFQVPVLYTYDPRQRKRSIGGIRSLAFSRDGEHLAVGGVGQIGNVDGLGGPAHVEFWNWQGPRRIFTDDTAGQKGMVNHLAFHPSASWLVGGGGGGKGFLSFWRTPFPEAASGDGKDSEKPAVDLRKVESDGHIHSFAFNRDGSELYAAGYGKLEVWGIGRSAVF